MKFDVETAIRKARSLGIIPRIHGDGFIQLDAPFLNGRIHGWGHPEIVGRGEPVKVHDHRFWLRSTVLRGAMQNLTYHLRESKDGQYQVCVIHRVDPSASKQGPPHEFPKLRDDRTFDLAVFRDQVVPCRSCYEHPSGVLHRSNPAALTLTFVEKLFQDDGLEPRVVVDRNVGVDPAASRYDTSSEDLYRILLNICYEGMM